MLDSTPTHSSFNFNLKNGTLNCEAWIPGKAIGIIILSNGTGTLAINKPVINLIQQIYNNRIAVIITRLLTAQELSDHKYRMDTELICQRMTTLIGLIKELPLFESLPLTLLGLGTGANGVLYTAARLPNELVAVAAINGHDLNTGLLEKLPKNLPALVMMQRTLGQEDHHNGISLPLNRNIQYQKVYRTDEVHPLAAMEEASKWLIQQIVRKKSSSIKIEHYELDPGR